MVAQNRSVLLPKGSGNAQKSRYFHSHFENPVSGFSRIPREYFLRNKYAGLYAYKLNKNVPKNVVLQKTKASFVKARKVKKNKQICKNFTSKKKSVPFLKQIRYHHNKNGISVTNKTVSKIVRNPEKCSHFQSNWKSNHSRFLLHQSKVCNLTSAL